MAIYRFKVTFEDHDEISREIEIRSDHSFEDFHLSIQQAIGFDAQQPASFYISNDHWVKGQEISLEKRPSRNGEPNIVMKNALLCEWINDPHQKIYYVFDYNTQWTFLIELVRIFVSEDVRKIYPLCVKVTGEAPKQKVVVAAHKGIKDADTEEVEDFVVDDIADESEEEEEGVSESYDGDEAEGMEEVKFGDETNAEAEEEPLKEDDEEK